MLDGDTLSTALAGQQQQQQSGSGWLEWHYYTSPTFPQLCCLRLLQCQHWMMALLSTLRRGCFKQISPFKSHIQMGELFLTFFHLCLACIHHKFEKKKNFFFFFKCLVSYWKEFELLSTKEQHEKKISAQIRTKFLPQLQAARLVDLHSLQRSPLHTWSLGKYETEIFTLSLD